MSLDATLWAWKQKLKPAQKLLLLSLADRAGENMECYPSVKRLESPHNSPTLKVLEKAAAAPGKKLVLNFE